MAVADLCRVSEREMARDADEDEGPKQDLTKKTSIGRGGQRSIMAPS